MRGYQLSEFGGKLLEQLRFDERLPEESNLQVEKEYLYWLLQVPFIGAVAIKRLWDNYHSFMYIYNMEETELKEKGLLNSRGADNFKEWKKYLAKCLDQYYKLGEKGIQFVTFLEEEYPKRLRPFYESPVGLYVKGNLPEEKRPTAAIIGARSCSHYGKESAELLGRTLAGAGIQVISGMALGIDGAGHRGVLKAGGDTYAILGCGVDICYPQTHFSMYLEILEKGGIISEYKPGEPPIACNFPMRNRIISGLSDVIIVVEARKKSGSLITVDCGLEQGKDIFAVPGRFSDELSEGCNQLIRQGAAIMSSPEDILEYFQLHMPQKLRLDEKNKNRLANSEKMLYSCLDLQPKFIDRIVEESGLSLGECLTLLLELELGGRIVQTANHYYAKKL